VISEEGVSMDQLKVLTVLDWLVPVSAKVVWGFLRLAGY
jgi:hypothetical protein